MIISCFDANFWVCYDHIFSTEINYIPKYHSIWHFAYTWHIVSSDRNTPSGSIQTMGIPEVKLSFEKKVNEVLLQDRWYRHKLVAF